MFNPTSYMIIRSEGHDIGAVIGMDIETALYWTDPGLNIKKLIQPLREVFKFKESGQDIINGIALLEQIKAHNAPQYPFDIVSLPAVTDRQKQVITEQLNKIYDRLEVAGDALLLESALQNSSQTAFLNFVGEIKLIEIIEGEDTPPSIEWIKP